MKKVVVIGGGISGLTAAYALQKRKVDFLLIESSDRLGGALRSERVPPGYLIEYGPNAIQGTSPLLLHLCEELGLTDKFIDASEAASKRFIVKNRQIVSLPTSLAQFLKTDLLSAAGKLRLLKEPFVRAGPPDDESLADFIRRRLGTEILDYAVNPFVAGIYAGRPEQLSVRHAFPRLRELEQQHGSLLKGALRGGRKQDARKADGQASVSRALFSFRDGLGSLPKALEREIGPSVRKGFQIEQIEHRQGRWIVSGSCDGRPMTEDCDALISTIPLHAWKNVSHNLSRQADVLAEAIYAPVAVLHLGFRRTDVKHPLDGFGYLVPEKESFNALGCLFNSSIFADRAPEGHVLVTCFVGGIRAPELVSQTDAARLQLVMADLREILGVSNDPTFENQVTWSHAIPQYGIGYGRIKDAITSLETAYKGLIFAGNYLRGVSVVDTLQSGWTAAERAEDFVRE